MSNAVKISKQQAIEQLWRRGMLVWLLDSNQKSLYDLFHNNSAKIQTWLLARRSGKTHTLCVLAIEYCLKNKGSIVKFVAPNKKQVERNIRPLMTQILESCPEDIKPEYVGKDEIYFFPNGSEIQLCGAEKGNIDSIRGGFAHIAIVDEAQDVSELKYAVNSVLLPTTLTTKGKVLLSGTPPKNPDHEFVEFIESCEEKETLIKRTVYDNPRLSASDIKEQVEAMNGENTEDFRREFLCVDENTLIKTDNGYKYIKNIEINDLVFTHNGRYKRVLNKFENNLGNRPVYKVRSSNNMGLICTEGHELYISTIIKNDLENIITNWEKVENIQPKNRNIRKYFKVPIDSTISSCDYTDELAYLIGWYIAEGHNSKSSQSTILSLNYKDNLEEINRCSKKIWGKEYKIYSKSDGCFQAILCSKVAKEFYKQFGEGAKNKKIPESLKRSKNRIKKILLKALWSGDGSYNLERRVASFASISIKLITDISDILLSLGIPHQIKKSKDEGKSNILGREVYIQSCYNITISGENFDSFLDNIFSIKSGSDYKRRARCFIKDGFLYSRITKITSIEYNKSTVYDIEVEDDHSYVGPHFTAHNCEIIKSSSNSVIPEFDDAKILEIVKEWPKPDFYHAYVSMDLGFKDWTVVLFGYYDFFNDKFVVEDEIVTHGNEMHLYKLGFDILNKEQKLWSNPITNEVIKPKKRVSDHDLIAINEIKKATNYKVLFEKAEKAQMVPGINFVRTLINSNKIIISPKCVTLIRHLKHAKWTSSDKEKLGNGADGSHYDAVPTLSYMIRAVDFKANPYPKDFNSPLRTQDAFYIEKPNQVDNVEFYKRMYNIKRR